MLPLGRGSLGAGQSAIEASTMAGATPGSKSLPSCAEVEADSALSGWVWKRSKHVGKWNRRYFVLWPKKPKPSKGRLLFYYSTPQVHMRNHPCAIVRPPRSSELVLCGAPGSGAARIDPARTPGVHHFAGQNATELESAEGFTSSVGTYYSNL